MLLSPALAGCTQEARDVGPAAPLTRPLADDDPRVAFFRNNAWQIAQGGRYFAWYGCGACHAEGATGVRDLADTRWRHGSGFAAVFGAIADRHGALNYAARVPVEQLWQMTAYTSDLWRHTPEKRRRMSKDQRAEPQGAHWQAPQ